MQARFSRLDIEILDSIKLNNNVIFLTSHCIVPENV